MLLLKRMILVFLCLFELGHCWDTQEMQMFDLVEEVNQNFYDFLGISQNASIGEIGKAYRKLTLRYHPDKNPGAEIANKFRHLVAIYEILKDDQMRERYHDVLKHGLPDWRMPSFYYRKLRKMSLFEIILLFSLLATLIHYACLWGVYFEKKLVEEAKSNKVFRRKKLQERKKDKENSDTTLSTAIPKPTWHNMLPLVLVQFIYYVVISIPETAKLLYFIIMKEVSKWIEEKTEKRRQIKEKENERKKLNELKKQKKERKLALSKEQWELRKNYELARKRAMMLPMETFTDLPVELPDEKQIENQAVELEPWSDENTVTLIRALVKFPSGVKERWVRISEMVQRPLSEVTAKVKEIQEKSKEGKIPIKSRMQNSLGAGVDDQIELDKSEQSEIQGVFIPSLWQHIDSSPSSGEESEEFCTKSKAQLKKERKKGSQPTTSITKPVENAEEIEQNAEENNENGKSECNVTFRKKPRKKASYLEPEQSIDAEDCVWNQVEQKQLEEAMRFFPNGTSNRWDRISQKVPTKTKAQCIDRIKKLSLAVQQKNSITT